MDALRLSALGGIRASAPNPALAPAKAQQGTAPSSKAVQDLAQSLFLQAFQAANALPGTESAPASATGLAGALLTALASPALTGTATPTTATAAPTPAIPATGTGPSALLATPPATPLPATPTLPTEATPVQAAPTDSTGVDFALRTALRFGAGVGAQADLAPPIPNLATGLVRDAAAVPRQENLQLHTGGSGTEASAQARASLAQAQAPYRTPPVAEPTLGLDLLA